METVLITGATGFLGSYLVHAMLKENFEVVILKRSTSDVWRIADVMDDIVIYNVDIDSPEKAFVENSINIVIHTSCNYGRNKESNSEVIQTNILFGLEVLECCIKHNVNTFINTDTLLHKGLNSYTLSKKQFVEWLMKLSTEVQIVNLKLEHMYGPKDSKTKFVPWVLSQFYSGVDEIRLTEGKQERDFIFIQDVISAYITIIKCRGQLEKFSEFDVTTGNFISIKSFVTKLKQAYEIKTGECRTKLNFGAIPYRDGEIMSIEGDNRELLDLGWLPRISIDQGLNKYIYEYNGYINKSSIE